MSSPSNENCMPLNCSGLFIVRVMLSGADFAISAVTERSPYVISAEAQKLFGMAAAEEVFSEDFPEQPQSIVSDSTAITHNKIILFIKAPSCCIICLDFSLYGSSLYAICAQAQVLNSAKRIHFNKYDSKATDMIF